MTEVRVRKVEDWVVEWHRHQAKAEGKTLESRYCGRLLTEAALAKKRAIADELSAYAGLEDAEGTPRVALDSRPVIIREDRDHRG